MKKNAYPHQKEDRDFRRLVEQEGLILSATELLFELMEKEGSSKADLARAVGKTRGHVSQILDGTRNMTLRTLADFAFALGHKIELDVKPLGSKAKAVVPERAQAAVYSHAVNVLLHDWNFETEVSRSSRRVSIDQIASMIDSSMSPERKIENPMRSVAA